MPDINDPYAILGILPSAESIVITAAYRALAQRYHPDKWSNDVELPHKRMSEINSAYSLVGNPTSRAEYDRAQQSKKQANFDDSDNDERANAFDSALRDMENRWKTASSIFPDLIELRQRLTAISKDIAFSFVVTLLETRDFQARAKIAENLKKQFLIRYFGTSVKVLDYALMLILAKEMAAARALNDLVEVIGSDVPAELLISKIDKEFGLSQKWKQNEELAAATARRRVLSSELQSYKDYESARNLCEAAGYEVGETGRGLFRQGDISLIRASKVLHSFETRGAFINWTLENIPQS